MNELLLAALRERGIGIGIGSGLGGQEGGTVEDGGVLVQLEQQRQHGEQEQQQRQQQRQREEQPQSQHEEKERQERQGEHGCDYPSGGSSSAATPHTIHTPRAAPRRSQQQEQWDEQEQQQQEEEEEEEQHEALAQLDSLAHGSQPRTPMAASSHYPTPIRVTRGPLPPRAAATSPSAQSTYAHAWGEHAQHGGVGMAVAVEELSVSQLRMQLAEANAIRQRQERHIQILTQELGAVAADAAEGGL
jgi:hypothetical protein